MSKIHMKTQSEKKEYMEFVASSQSLFDATERINDPMLVGSNEIDEDDIIRHDESEVPRPIKFKISDWYKKNIFKVIVTGFLLPLVVATLIASCNFTMDTTERLAVIDQKIITIEESIKTLEFDSKDFVNKEELLTQLSLIKEEMRHGTSLDLNDIHWRLTIIEGKLDEGRV